MKHLHLLIGDRLPESPAPLPHLDKLLARGAPSKLPETGDFSSVLAWLFGVAPDALPALTLASEGIDPDRHAWFRADPVHLVAGMHSLTLLDGRHFQLRDDERTGLIADLNRHFHAEITFLAPHAMRWYARFAQPMNVAIPPLDRVAGTAIDPDRITGPDARAIQRLAMEIQMILHDHPINAARDLRNEATVNALWFWGGAAFQRPRAGFAGVYTDTFATRALAEAAGIPVRALPEDAAEVDVAGDILLDLSAPDALTDADRRWFKPVLDDLRFGRLNEVRLIGYGGAGWSRRIDRARALAFWKRDWRNTPFARGRDG